MTTITKATPNNIQEKAINLHQCVLDYIDSLASNLTPAEKQQFISICILHNLNPITREIYAIKYGSKFSIVVGYEVYLKRALASGLYNGYSSEISKTEEGHITCKVTVHRKEVEHPTVHTVFFNEVKLDTPVWKAKPRFMLEKVAVSQAFRRAFADIIGGLPYTKEEMGIESNYTYQSKPIPASQNASIDAKNVSLSHFIKPTNTHEKEGVSNV